MPKINGLGKVEKLTVQKSQPLYALWNSDLTLAEFKILDVYLSRINSHKPENRVVVFSKEELEEKFGVGRIRNEDLKLRLKHLMGNVVELPDDEEPDGFRLVTLFEEAVAKQDEHGIWRVRLECTQKAMKYFFNIEKMGYLRYKLRCITALNSRYSYIMFLYLENHRNMGTVWQEDIEDLKRLLGCTEESYSRFKVFNDRVLKRVQQELHQKTDTHYTYSTIKNGRNVVAIQFELSEKKSKPNYDLVNNDLVNDNLVDNNLREPAKVVPERVKPEPQAEEPPVKEPKMIESPQGPVRVTSEEPVMVISEEPVRVIPAQEPPQELEYQNDTLEFLASACNNEFNNVEMLVIFEILATKKLEETGMGVEFDRYHFLAKKYSELRYYATKMKIYNRFSYFKKMLEY